MKLYAAAFACAFCNNRKMFEESFSLRNSNAIRPPVTTTTTSLNGKNNMIEKYKIGIREMML